MAPPKKSVVEAPEEIAPEPVLTITLSPQRPTIDVDGTLYELRLMRDFSITDQQGLNRDGRAFATLWNSEKALKPVEQKRLKFLLERLFKQVLIIPADDDVAKRFADADKADVVLHFTLAPLRKMMAEAMAAQATPTETDEEEQPEDI